MSSSKYFTYVYTDESGKSFSYVHLLDTDRHVIVYAEPNKAYGKIDRHNLNSFTKTDTEEYLEKEVDTFLLDNMNDLYVELQDALEQYLATASSNSIYHRIYEKYHIASDGFYDVALEATSGLYKKLSMATGVTGNAKVN